MSPLPPPLAGSRVLVLEDDYFLAKEVACTLRHAGARVLGPYVSEVNALLNIEDGNPCLAILDIRLGDRASFGAAQELKRRRIPFVFLTALNPATIPPEFAQVELLRKPVDLGLLVLAAASLLKARSARH